MKHRVGYEEAQIINRRADRGPRQGTTGALPVEALPVEALRPRVAPTLFRSANDSVDEPGDRW